MISMVLKIILRSLPPLTILDFQANHLNHLLTQHSACAAGVILALAAKSKFQGDEKCPVSLLFQLIIIFFFTSAMPSTDSMQILPVTLPKPLSQNAQLEKQYQDLLRELEQKEHEHVLEINSLKEETCKLRAEMEGMLVELQTLMDAKLSLELEIAAYRKLLEGEETR